MTTTDYQSTGPNDPRLSAIQTNANQPNQSGANQIKAGQVPTDPAGTYDAPYRPSAGYYQPPAGPINRRCRRWLTGRGGRPLP